jgi:large subunit ribosomal protein L5
MDQALLTNPMRGIRISKVVVNSAIGQGGARLEKAAKILEQLTGQKPSIRRAKKTIKGFGIRKGEPIAVMVTLRGKKAQEFLQRALDAVGRRVRESSFDEFGNFAFGVKEHLEFPGTRYDPELGIIGMDIIVSLTRPGERVASRRLKRARISRRHRVMREEGIKYAKEVLGVAIV